MTIAVHSHLAHSQGSDPGLLSSPLCFPPEAKEDASVGHTSAHFGGALKNSSPPPPPFTLQHLLGHPIVRLQVAMHLPQENRKTCLLGTVSGTPGTQRQPVECGGPSGLRLD